MQFNLGKIGVRFVVKSPFLYTNMVQPSKVEDFSDTPQFWQGETEKGNDILNGVYNWSGSKEVDLESPWDGEYASYSWIEYAHSFEWIYDVRASINTTSQNTAYNWLKDWLVKFEKIEAPIWRSDIVARRLSCWLANFEYLSDMADKKTYDLFVESISRHIGHLIFTNGYDCKTVEQELTSIRGLIIGLLATKNETIDIKELINKFCQILEDNLNSDGMNKKRSIKTQISFAKDVFMVESMLNKMSMDVPNVLENAVVKILSVLKVFIYQDGELAHFASSSGSTYVLRQMFNRYNRKLNVSNVLEETGFYNVIADKTQFFFDAGNRHNTSSDDAGILSFEMNYKKSRIFVNCGYCISSDNPLYNACKNTAAHNSITVDDYNATSLGNKSRPTNVGASITTEQGWTLLQGWHDGFKNVCGSTLKRAIAINEDGTEIKGQEKLEQIQGVRKIISRFHLHPDVNVLLTSNNREAIIKVGKEGWKFKALGGDMSLAESFYMDKDGNRRTSQQIVVQTNSISQNVTIKWHIEKQSF